MTTRKKYFFTFSLKIKSPTKIKIQKMKKCSIGVRKLQSKYLDTNIMNFSKLLRTFIYFFVVWRRWSICKRRLLNVFNSIQSYKSTL